MLFLLFALLQTPTPQQTASTQPIYWDQAAPDLSSAQRYVYTLYVDGAATGTVLTATCAPKPASSVFDCESTWPALTPGLRSVQITAKDGPAESAKSPAKEFVFLIAPATPANIRTVK